MMTAAVKNTTFDEYYETLCVITKYIEKEINNIKNRQKNLPITKGYKNFKDFLKSIERNALKAAAEELGIGDTTVKDRWRVLTLPAPVYCAIESGEISFSKAKLMTAIHFDFENENDIKVAEEIVEEIKKGIKNPEIKELVKESSSKVWNHTNIAIEKVVEQLGVNAESKF